MKKQHGKLSGLAIVGIGFVSVTVLAIVTVIATYIKYHDYAAGAENVIDAEYTNMENILASYSLKVGEAAQVPGMYKDDFKDLVTSEMQSKFGKGGSKAMFQWFKERNLNFDSGMYKKIQIIIEAGRNKFENAQTKFIDTKRQYKTKRDKVWSGFWIGAAGYPKIDLSKYKIISSGHAQKTFETGVDAGLKLR